MRLRRFSAWFFFVTAPLWSFALYVGFRSAFGMFPIMLFTGTESFYYALFISAPVWLAAFAWDSSASAALFLRIVCLLLLGYLSVLFGHFVLRLVLFAPLRDDWWLLANLLLFRLPFVLAFVSEILLCILVVQDLRGGTRLEIPAVGMPARPRPPEGGYW